MQVQEYLEKGKDYLGRLHNWSDTSYSLKADDGITKTLTDHAVFGMISAASVADLLITGDLDSSNILLPIIGACGDVLKNKSLDFFLKQVYHYCPDYVVMYENVK